MIDRATDRYIVLGFVGYALAITLWLIANHSEPLIDDSFYYLRIAQFIAAGKGSTFDGINLTNGYHPLWLLFLVPVFRLTPDPNTARVITECIEGVLFSAGVSLFYLTARLQVGRLAAIVATSLWVLLTYNQSLGGTEFGLHATCLLATAYVYLRWFAQGGPLEISSYLLLGLLSSLTFLARLDAILLAAIIGIFLIPQASQIRSVRGVVVRLLAFGLPILIVSLAYAVANLVLFGHALPVSAVVKGSWSAYYLAQDPVYQVDGWLAAKAWLALLPLRLLVSTSHLSYLLYPLSLSAGVFAAIGLLLGGVFLLHSSAWSKSITGLTKPLAPFTLYSLLSFVSYIVLYHGSISYYPWYYLVQPWLSGLILAVVMNGVVRALGASGLAKGQSHSLRPLTAFALIALGLAIPLYTVRQIWPVANSAPALSRDPLYEAATWIRENAPPDAVIGSWNAGIVSFYSGRRVINLDGLANSWDFYETRQYDLCRYWKEAGISYLADGFEGDQAMSPIPSYKDYSRCVDRLEMLWAKSVPQKDVQIKIYKIKWTDD